MTNYIFLLELYFILTILTFLYPKELQKRNHIVNAFIIALFLMLVELVVIPNNGVLTFSDVIQSGLYTENAYVFEKIPTEEQLKTTNNIVIQHFKLSLLIPAIFFLVGRLAYAFDLIKLNTFDILYTGLFAFLLIFDFFMFFIIVYLFCSGVICSLT